MSFHDYKPPRRVEGGIRARSTRGDIGSSWWSKRFLAVLESFALGTRLTRGRAYARRGQVLTLDVASGVVTASVQGSRAQPYTATIGLAPYPDQVWSTVESALADQALYSAQLLAGELPAEIEDVFAGVDAPLFPASVADLAMRCTCPDWSVPCKHLAATFYLLAEDFDRDPFQLLRWRGRDRETLLANLRALRNGGAADLFPAPRDEPAPPPIGAGTVLAEVTAPDDMLDRFWVSPVPLPEPPAALDVEPDLLLRQLPEPGADLGGEELVDRLRPAYLRWGGG